MELADIWGECSRLCLAARNTETAGAAETELRVVMRAASGTPLEALMLFWIAENYRFEIDWKLALDRFSEFEGKFGDRRFLGRPLLPRLLEQKALVYRKMGDRQSQMETLHKCLHTAGSDLAPGSLRMAIGLAAEDSGKDSVAMAYFDAASRSKWNGPGWDAQSQLLAARNADWLRTPNTGVRSDPQSLAREIEQALASRNASKLDNLASRTHFGLGAVGGHWSFADRGKLLHFLMADLGASVVQCDAETLMGVTGKRYMLSYGWKGSYLRGVVAIYLQRVRNGWEWRGFGVTEPASIDPRLIIVGLPHNPWRMDPGYDGKWQEPKEKGTGDGKIIVRPDIASEDPPDASFIIKAPWRGGLNCFAGGMWNPRTDDTCGRSYKGLYYLEWEHGFFPVRYFAIDFVPAHPDGSRFSNTNVEILSCAPGLVGFYHNAARFDGDSSETNEVNVMHARVDGTLRAQIAEYLRLETRGEHVGSDVRERLLDTTESRPGARVGADLTSIYGHLSAENGMPTSWFMEVVVTPHPTLLGFLDSTGNSLFNHLHFSLADRRRSFPTDFTGRTLPMDWRGMGVPATPMDVSSDGTPQTLTNSRTDNGRCVFSTQLR